MAKTKKRGHSAHRRSASSYGGSKKRTHRRKNTLNAKVDKKLGAIGLLAGAGTVLVPSAIQAVRNKSIAPIANVPTAVNTAVRGGIGYLVGRAGGMIIDKFAKPLKRPINKVARVIGVR